MAVAAPWLIPSVDAGESKREQDVNVCVCVCMHACVLPKECRSKKLLWWHEIISIKSTSVFIASVESWPQEFGTWSWTRLEDGYTTFLLIPVLQSGNLCSTVKGDLHKCHISTIPITSKKQVAWEVVDIDDFHQHRQCWISVWETMSTLELTYHLDIGLWDSGSSAKWCCFPNQN